MLVNSGVRNEEPEVVPLAVDVCDVLRWSATILILGDPQHSLAVFSVAVIDDVRISSFGKVDISTNGGTFDTSQSSSPPEPRICTALERAKDGELF